MSSSAHRIKINVLHYLRLLQKQLWYSLLASMSFVLRTVEERLGLKLEMLKIVEDDVVALVVVFLQRVLLASLLALTMDDASRHRLEILLYYYFDGAVVDGEDNESGAADGVVS